METYEFDINDMAVCAVTGKKLPKKFMTMTEDYQMVDKAVHDEAFHAFKTVLLTTKQVEQYWQLKQEFRSQLLLTARILRKMVNDRAELKEVLKWYVTYEEEASFKLFNKAAACMSLPEHLCLLKAFETEYGWIDDRVTVTHEMKFNGGGIPMIETVITSGHHYTPWVQL